MFKLIVVSLLVIVAVNAHNFTNPLVQHGADPWMIYYKGYYYLLVTPWDNTISMRKAKTLADLNTAKNVQIYSFVGNTCWAPEVHQLDGKWYLYYTGCLGNDTSAQCHRNHVAEAAGDDPMGPYTFKTTFIDPQNNLWNEIDPSVIKINKKLYQIGANACNVYIRLLSSPIKAEGTKTYIAKPTYKWETSEGPCNEGPEALYNGNRTFIVYSGNSCGTPEYKLGLLEFNGTDPMNANHWKKYPNPVFVKDPSINVYGPGHNGFFKSPDGKEDWIIYHANSASDGRCDGNRNPRAKKFTFGSDGLPVFGKPDAAGIILEGPSGEP